MLMDKLGRVARVVQVGDPDHRGVVWGDLLLGPLEHRRLRNARGAPGGEHVHHHDLAVEIGQALSAPGVKHGEAGL